MKTETADNPLRKAALLLRSLDSESLAAMLARLSPLEAKAVRAAVRDLRDVDPEERQRLAEEFRGLAVEPRELESPGHQSHEQDPVELSIGKPSSSSHEERGDAGNRHEASPPHPFTSLGQTDVDTLVACLEKESPTTVAVVLSYLPSPRASEALSRLPEDLKTASLDRLLHLGEVDAESMEVIAQELGMWIAQRTSERRIQADRRATLLAILEATPKRDRLDLVDRLRSQGHGWVASIQPAKATETERIRKPTMKRPPCPAPRQLPEPARPQWRFSQLESIDTQTLAATLGAVEPDILALAMVGASERLMRRIESLADRRQAKQLRRRIVQVGPVSLRDIEAAQRSVASIAQRVASSATPEFTGSSSQ